MEKVALTEIWSAVNALVPVYSEGGGNATEIYLEGGMALRDPRKVKSICHALARIFRLDRFSETEANRMVLDRRNLIPLAYHESLVLIPLLFRVAKAKDDGCLGYINLRKYLSSENVRGEKRRARIKFADGTALVCQSSLKQVLSQVVNGRVVLQDFLAQTMAPVAVLGQVAPGSMVQLIWHSGCTPDSRRNFLVAEPPVSYRLKPP